MASNDTGRLVRAERVSSLLRNIVIVIAAIASVVLFTVGFFKKDVEVRVHQEPISGSRFLVSDRDTTAALLETLGDSQGDAGHLANYVTRLGRLDSIDQIEVANETNEPVELVVRMKHVERSSLDPTDVDKGEFMRSQFLLVDIFSSCPLADDEPVIGNEGFLFPGDTGELELKSFPAGCELHFQVARSRAGQSVTSVIANGKLLEFSRATHVHGILGDYIDLVQDNPPISVFLFLLFPLFWLLWIVIFLWRVTKDALVGASQKRSANQPAVEGGDSNGG